MFFNLIGRKRKDAAFHTERKAFSNQPDSYGDFCMEQLNLCNGEPDTDFNKKDFIDTPRRETLTKLKAVP